MRRWFQNADKVFALWTAPTTILCACAPTTTVVVPTKYTYLSDLDTVVVIKGVAHVPAHQYVPHVGAGHRIPAKRCFGHIFARIITYKYNKTRSTQHNGTVVVAV